MWNINNLCKMKKLFMALMLLLACQGMAAQQAQTVFNEYKTHKKASYYVVPKTMLGIAGAGLKRGTAKELLNQLEAARVLSLDDCRRGVRRRFAKQVSALAGKGYEEYGRLKQGDDNILVLIKQTDRYIGEMVVLVTDEDDCMGVLLTGQLNREDVQAVLGAIDM